MIAVVVSMRVKPDGIDEFVAAITTQAEASLRDEPGCLRFDVLRLRDDPYGFLLYELYVDETAFFDQHRSSPHYATWSRAAAELLEGDRTTTIALPVVEHLISESRR